MALALLVLHAVPALLYLQYRSQETTLVATACNNPSEDKHTLRRLVGATQ